MTVQITTEKMFHFYQAKKSHPLNVWSVERLQNMLQSYFPIHKTYFSFLMHHWNWHFLLSHSLRCRIIFWGFWHFSRIEQWTPNASVAFFVIPFAFFGQLNVSIWWGTEMILSQRNEMVGWWQKSHLKLNKLFWNSRMLLPKRQTLKGIVNFCGALFLWLMKLGVLREKCLNYMGFIIKNPKINSNLNHCNGFSKI